MLDHKVKSCPNFFQEHSSLLFSNFYKEPVASKKGRECEWEVMHGFEFIVGDFSTKADSLDQVIKSLIFIVGQQYFTVIINLL